MRGLIGILWRAGLRIHEALALTEASDSEETAPRRCRKQVEAEAADEPRSSRYRLNSGDGEGGFTAGGG
jgi:hypothetical protein